MIDLLLLLSFVVITFIIVIVKKQEDKYECDYTDVELTDYVADAYNVNSEKKNKSKKISYDSNYSTTDYSLLEADESTNCY